MNFLKLSIFIILTTTLFSSCQFIRNYYTYRATAKEFVNDLLLEDYDHAARLFAIDRPEFEGTNIDTLKAQLPGFREIIVNNFGEQLTYPWTSANKHWTTVEEERTPPNTTTVLLQIANDKDFGALSFWFDDHSKKVLFVKPLQIKEPIPNMTIFWLFGLLALCIPAFNIYVIVKVKRSQYRKKWLKYLAIILLNVPAIGYQTVGGLTFEPLSLQVLLGASFEYMGYLGSSWTFGIPLGGLFILWQLRRGKDKPVEGLAYEASGTESSNDEGSTENTSETEN